MKMKRWAEGAGRPDRTIGGGDRKEDDVAADDSKDDKASRGRRQQGE